MSDLVVAEVPAWRQVVSLVLTTATGADGWCVRWRDPDTGRCHRVEHFDSRYSAEQGLARYRAFEAGVGTSGLRELVRAGRLRPVRRWPSAWRR